MKVTPIRPNVNALSARFDEIVKEASDIAIVAVKPDGTVLYLLNDQLKQGAALIGALEIMKADIVAAQFEDL